MRGNIYGRLTVVERAIAQYRGVYWRCRCVCGKFRAVRSDHLTSGKIESCGCLRKERTREAHTKHGHDCVSNRSPTYVSWREIFHRCDNPKYDLFSRYGGRGITYDPRWRSFDAFLSDMGERPPGCTLDRIDYNGNYEKSNCRWATPKQQGRNTVKTIWVVYKNERLPLITLAERLGINTDTFWGRWNKSGRPENVEDLVRYYEKKGVTCA